MFAGGGIYNEGKATITDCEISGNEAQWGGGVTNTNYGTMEITDSKIIGNTAKQGYGGIGNAGNLTVNDTEIKNNTAQKLGGGIGNNTGKMVLNNVDFSNNISIDDEYDDIWSNPPYERNTSFSSLSAARAEATPVYEFSAPSEEELYEKMLTYWEFSAVSTSPVRDWEVIWGDGSESTLILGGPRSWVSVTHYFAEPGTYVIKVRTTDFNGIVTAATIGTYTVKERVVEPFFAAAASFAVMESLPDAVEFLLQEEPAIVSLASPVSLAGENRITFAGDYAVGLGDSVADMVETMRLRQMLDLDQSGDFGRKSDSVSFTELIWADDDLFDDEWAGLPEQEENDFWNEVFEDELLSLK